MKLFLQKSLFTLLLSSSLLAFSTQEIAQEHLTLEENNAIVYQVLNRWEGQEHRIKQLMYESTLSEKPLQYYNGDDRVATFNNNDQTVLTYLDKDGKISVGLTYEQILVIADSTEQESAVSEPDITIEL